ncbi:armadillo-type protein [Paraphysoderma sedebokerense]|nr:armadillo-type protein [Paraphysoderma sedebokerense]
MIPFDMRKVDSGHIGGVQKSIIEQLMDVGKQYLTSTGKEREGAAILLARLLTRKDTAESALISFISWAVDTVRENGNIFMRTGILTTLCTIYEYGQRSFLLKMIERTLPCLQLLQDKSTANNALLRKLLVKLGQRLGMVYLKPKVASWRYQRGQRSLSHNLLGKDIHTPVDRHDQNISVSDEDEEVEVPEEMEEIIEILLNGLKDKDTIVRWSSAKGLGRLACRLPRELATDIIDSVTELFAENTIKIPSADNMGYEVDMTGVSDHTWHGVCLCVAEFARRGILLPERLPEVVEWVIKAINFDVRRGSHSIGAHVRDAACYVCWSFARAYAPEIMRPFVQQLSNALVVVSVYDREVNIRRASSAAFQENVGRQGIFPHGIDIITLADYFTVGNRTSSFLDVSFEIAKFPEYRTHLIDHLVVRTSRHWDRSMRELGARAMAKLATLDPAHIISNALPVLMSNVSVPDLHTRHGSILAVGEICLALHNMVAVLLDNYPEVYVHSVGSDITRSAICRFISCLSQCRFKLSSTTYQNLLSFIQTSLERKEEPVQEMASEALHFFVDSYGVDDKVLKRWINGLVDYDSGAINQRRGYALALGRLPEKVLIRHLDGIVNSLSEAIKVQTVKQHNDAELRRNGMFAILQIVKTLKGSFKQAVPQPMFKFIVETALHGLDDYSTDSRGDVGSWIRKASMVTLQYLIPLAAKWEHDSSGEKYLNPELVHRVVAGCLQQSVEKIDKVRECAGMAVKSLLYVDLETVALCDNSKSGAIPFIPAREALETVIPRDIDIDWLTPADVFPRMVKLLPVREYCFEVMIGMVVSVGGLTETLASVDESFSLDTFASLITEIFTKHPKHDRIIIPLLETLDLLYDSGSLYNVTDSSFHESNFTLIKAEVHRIKDVKKLHASIKIFTHLISVPHAPTRIKSLTHLLSNLVHPYPRIRKATAESLYLKMSDYFDVCVEEGKEVDEEQIEQVLCETNWDLPVSQLKPIRNTLYDLLYVPMPAIVKSQSMSSLGGQSSDSLS